MSIPLLLAVIDEAYDRKAWHGPTLRGALRGVGAGQADWRPSRRAHTIRELTVHAAYWKYAVRRLITGEKRGSFPLAGSNWFVRPSKQHLSPTERERAWAHDVRLLGGEHRKLRAAVASLSGARLRHRASGKSYSVGFTVRGVAAHDLYHAGQVQLIKRLYKDKLGLKA